MSDYPEHEKLAGKQDEAETVQGFIDSISQEGYEICRLVPSGRNIMREELKEWQPIDDPNVPMAIYFGIDRDKLAAEKQAMFEALRAGAKR
jgi:hypothetical protein